MISPVKLSRVHQQPSQHPDVVDPEGRPAGGHRGRLAGLVAGHHVGVPLDDHRPAALGDLPLGEVEPVEHVRLLVERRLGRVQVLRTVVVVEQLPRAEPDHVAGHFLDRPQQPPPEPVDQRPRPGRLGQPGGGQLLRRETLLPQMLGQQVPALGGETAAVLLGRVPAEAALGQELAGLARAGGGELVAVEVLARRRARPAAAASARPAAAGLTPGRSPRTAAGSRPCRPGARSTRRTTDARRPSGT